MKRRYLELMGDSGITEVNDSVLGTIDVWFGSKGYRYTNANSGVEHVQAMRERAAANNGLATYINQNKASLKPIKL